jgi:4-amino-4-deoxy-L-arabinose transferase-like glycosyltransferase
VPLPRNLRHWKAPSVIHDQYWQLPMEERSRREAAFRAIQPDLAFRTAGTQTIYEAMQPPLYYWIVSIPDRLAAGAHLAERVVILRWLSLLIASAVIPLTYFIGRRVLPHHGLAVLACVLAAALPGLAMDVSRVGNDCLAIALAAAFLLQSLRSLSGSSNGLAAFTGLLLGLGLLSKAYLLALVPIPAAVALCQVARRRCSWRRATGGCGITLAVALAIGGWWYAANWMQTGTISGEQVDVAAARFSWMEKLHAVANVRWLTALDAATFSHVWWGNWSFLGLRSWMYHLVRAAAFMAGIGLAWLVAKLFRRAWRRQVIGLFSAQVALLLLSYALFSAGIAYYTMSVFLLTGQSPALGWYWYAMIAAEVTLLTIGTRMVTCSNRAGFAAMACVIVLFVAMDLYATHWLLIPYYSGLIRFRPDGPLASFHLTNAFPVGLPAIVDRLSTNKAGFVQSVIPVLWFLYVLATLGLPAFAIRRWCDHGPSAGAPK